MIHHLYVIGPVDLTVSPPVKTLEAKILYSRKVENRGVVMNHGNCLYHREALLILEICGHYRHS